MPAPRRRATAVVWTAVVLAVLVGGAVLADLTVRRTAEERIAAQVADGIPGVEGTPAVTVMGFPFLPQLASGSLDEVHVAVDAAVVEGLRLEGVSVEMTGVSTAEPYTAESVRLEGLAPTESVLGAIDIGMDMELRDGDIVAATEVLGLPLEVLLEARADGRSVAIDVVAFSLAGLRIDADRLPGAITDRLSGIEYPVAGLPEGLDLTGLVVREDGFLLTAAGEDVTFDAPA